MSKIERFEDIESWKVARELANHVYAVSASGAFARDFGLKDQMRRASISVLSNIAEGFERTGNKEFVQFLAVAKGSCGELRAQLYVALDQSYITKEQFDTLTEKAVKTSQLIAGFIRYLQHSELRGTKFKR